MHHSPTVQSSMEGSASVSPTLNFLLSSGVSCASIPSTTLRTSAKGRNWDSVICNNWNSAMFLFLDTPLTAATPNECTSVCGTSHCRSEYLTVQNNKLYIYMLINAHTKWKTFACVSKSLSVDRQMCQVAATTQWDSQPVTGPQGHTHTIQGTQ